MYCYTRVACYTTIPVYYYTTVLFYSITVPLYYISVPLYVVLYNYTAILLYESPQKEVRPRAFVGQGRNRFVLSAGWCSCGCWAPSVV